MSTQKIFRYKSSKSSHKMTTFDQTYQNLFTARFGELLPTTCKKVLAKDKWSLGVNTLTKVAPMTAPAFTRIKQNNFAFFVPNQVIWKYWNDFITNGTEVQDVVGSNAFNQDLDGVFREPCTRLSTLALPLKFARGWASPIHSLKNEVTFDFNSFMTNHLTSCMCDDDPDSAAYSVFDTTHYGVCSTKDYIFELPAGGYVLPSLSARLFSFLNKVSGGSLNWLYEKVAFLPLFEVVKVTEVEVSQSVSYNAYELRLLDILFFCSSTQFVEVVKTLLLGDTYSFKFDVVANATESSDIENYVSTEFVSHIPFCCFKNSTDSTNKVSPFIIEKTSFSYNLYHHFQGIDIVPRKSEDYRVIEDNASLVSIKTSYDGGFYKYFMETDYPLKLRDSSFGVGVTYYIDYNYSFLLPTAYDDGDWCSATDYERVDLSSDSPVFGCFSPSDYMDNLLSNTTLTTSFNLYDTPSEVSSSDLGVNGGYYYDYFALPLYFSKYLVSFNFPYYVDKQISMVSNHSLLQLVPVSFDSLLHSMSFEAWLYHLLDGSARLCDMLNTFPFDVYSCSLRSMFGFNISLLPGIAYGRIWCDYFRNAMVSTPDPEYEHLNGLCYYSALSASDKLISATEFVENVNLPTISVSRLPLVNSNLRFSYIVDNWFSLLSILFGIDMNISFGVSLGATYYNSRFILPNYYNSIFSLRYQNFAKDYFSSAVFDPMSGANDVPVPDTITELRSAQRMASFWQRTAFTRSVREFFGQNFDVTPTHDQMCKPYLLGASHIDINVGEVIQQSQTTSTSPQGQRSGLAASHGSRGLVKNRFDEQGYLFVLTSHTLEQQYMQRLDKQSLAYDSFLDYPFPDFVGLGNQSIKSHELCFVGDSLNNTSSMSFTVDFPGSRPFVPSLTKMTTGLATSFSLNSVDPGDSSFANHSIFGYTPRFTEYKFSFDECHGDFLRVFDFWHSFRRFYSQPTLCHEFVSWEFVVDDDDLKRLFADPTTTDYFFVDMFVNETVQRMLPLQSKPEGV